MVMVLVVGISCSPEGYKGTAGACSCDNGYRGSVSYDYEKNAPTGCTGQLKWNCIGHPCHEFGMTRPLLPIWTYNNLSAADTIARRNTMPRTRFLCGSGGRGCEWIVYHRLPVWLQAWWVRSKAVPRHLVENARAHCAPDCTLSPFSHASISQFCGAYSLARSFHLSVIV